MTDQIFRAAVRLHKPESPLSDGTANLGIELDRSAGSEKLVFAGEALGQSATPIPLDLTDIKTTNGVFRAKLASTPAFLNLDIADLSFTSAEIEARLEKPTQGWSNQAPFFTMTLCGTLSGETKDQIKLPGGNVDAAAGVSFKVCAELTLIAPPQEAGGISNIAVRLRLPDFGVGSRWLPLPVLDPGKWSDFDMPGILNWFADLLPDLKPVIKDYIQPINWDTDFSLDLDFPLGIRPQNTRFQLRLDDEKKFRVALDVQGLNLYWGDGEPLEYDDFRLQVEWDGSKYQVYCHIIEAQYPKDDEHTDPFGFALPFGVLSITAQCWYFRFGFFAHQPGGGEVQFCFDTLLEIGGFVVASPALSDKPLYETDLRLHMRDLSVLTGEPNAATKFFANAQQNAVIKPFQQIDIPALSFANDLSAEPGAPNDYGLEIIAGDYQADRRIFLAWKQHSVSRLLRALMHDLIGTEAAGALPDDAKSVTLALELAWFGEGDEKDTQLRLDLFTGETADTSQKDIAVPSSAETCFNLTQLERGIILPGGPIADTNSLSDATTGKNPFALNLPGLSFSVRRPTAHSLVYRREGYGSDHLSWLVSYDGGAELKKGEALAEASLDFALNKPGQKRQVQPAKDGPFLRVVLGTEGTDGATDAIELIGWSSDASPRYFQAYTGTKPFGLMPKDASTPLDETKCPPPPAAPWEPLAIVPGVFSEFALGKKDGPFLLGISAQIKSALLKQFGADRGIKFEIDQLCISESGDSLVIRTKLEVKLTESETLTGDADFRLRLADLALSIDDDASLGLQADVATETPEFIKALSPEVVEGNKLDVAGPKSFAGFDLFAVTEVPKDADPKSIQLLSMSMDDGAFSLRVPENTQLLLRYDEFGDDGLTFSVDTLVLGGGGLDLSAALLATTLKLPGLQKPFALDQARLEIVGGVMSDLTISGSGQLPELLNSAPVSIALSLQQRDGRIRLVDFDCALGNGEAPIFSRGTRCRFDLTKIAIGMDDGNGTKPTAWFFKISGSVQMQPDGFELLGNLLEDFKSIRMEFTDAPLGDEFFDHIELIATLNKPERFKVLGLFDMEVRSIGFHPKFDGFDEAAAAIIIGGQIAFADLGDVLSVDVDFHRIYLGMPKQGDVIPQVHAKGLRVEIATSGFKIAGRVEYYKDDLIDGFGGEGTVLVPGLPELSAAFAFAKLRAEVTDGWKRGWFIAIDAARISFQIGPLPLYLRQIGLGFGYRYTSVLIKTFESEDELGKLIKLMLREIENHHSLARLDSWAPDPERDGQQSRWSIGLEAMFSMASANTSPTTYNKQGEQGLQTLLAQMLLFLRSDFTFMAAAKVWFPVSADDFFENVEDMRKRPLALGFMAYSAPKSRLLIHAAKGKNPYLGKQPAALKNFLEEMLNNSHFEATFLSEPGLVHAELGWPDRLFFKYKIGALTIECRGGVLFRLEKDMLIQGVYFSARGDLSVSASVSLGIVGTSISAHISVSFGMRLMMGISLSRPLDSKIYAAVGLDISLRFAIHIWFRLNLRFFKISIDIHFSLEIQIVVALEVGWAGQGDLGFRAQATVMIAAFGRGLKVKINVSAGNGVDGARKALSPYMSSFLEPGAIPPLPGLETPEREAVLLSGQEFQSLDASAPALATPPSLEGVLDVGEPPSTPLANAQLTPLVVPKALRTDPKEASFTFAVRAGKQTEDSKGMWFGWIMPSPRPKDGQTPLYPPVFFPIPQSEETDQDQIKRYGRLCVPKTSGAKVYVARPGDGQNVTWRLARDIGSETVATLKIRPFASAKLTEEATGAGASLTLQQFLAGCHVPANPKDYGQDDPSNTKANRPFPLNWSGFDLTNQSLDVDDRALRDDRLTTANSEALNTRRKLDPDHSYDRALMDAIDKGEPIGSANPSMLAGEASTENVRKKQLQEQALGTQSYLFRSFQDDFTWLADQTQLVNGMPMSQPFLTKDRPHIGDLGMVVCVVADECPDWLCRFPDGEPPASLELNGGVVDGWEVDSKVPPVIDFKDANFAEKTPNIEQGPSYLDDESVVFTWNTAWHTIPAGVIDNPDIEDFLDHYQFTLYQVGSERPLEPEPGKLNPCDILTPNDKKAFRRLKTRFQYVKKISELAIELGETVSRTIQLRAVLRPVSQDGSVGEEVELLADYRLSATPLPADGATARMTQTKEGGFTGKLYWREPVPPEDPTVARTKRWELILRPISPLPLGAYPAETVDTNDSGLGSFSAPGLTDGDIVVTFSSKDLTIDTPPDIWQDDEDASQSDIARTFELDISESWKTQKSRLGARVFDHLGQEVPESAENSGDAYDMVRGFFDKRNATRLGGAGWKLFLRSAATQLNDGDDTLPETGYGSLSRVSLLLEVPALEAEPGTQQDEVDDEAARTRFRTLEHLEWPEQVAVTQVAFADLDFQVGPMSLAGMDVNPESGALRLTYFALPGTDRSVTLTWNTVPESTTPVEVTARFVLYEARADQLVNLDRIADRDTGFQLDWTVLKTINLTDAAFAARAATSFVQPEIWDHMPPVRRETLRRMKHIPAQEQTSKWPGWYSWADSALRWPDIDLDSELWIKETNRASGTAPLLNLRDTADEDRTVGKDIAALHALGSHAARRELHPWLTCVIGELVRRGAPGDLGGAGVSDALFNVEVSPGRPGPMDANADPLSWMQQDVEPLDPLGWGALSHLGLAFTIALRDPVTGVFFGQHRVRRELADAVAHVTALADRAQGTDEKIDIRVRAEHLSIDIPLQTSSALRSGSGDRDLNDTAALSMVQVALRPVPRPYEEDPYEASEPGLLLTRNRPVKDAVIDNDGDPLRVYLRSEIDITHSARTQRRRFAKGATTWVDIFGSAEQGAPDIHLPSKTALDELLADWDTASQGPFPYDVQDRQFPAIRYSVLTRTGSGDLPSVQELKEKTFTPTSTIDAKFLKQDRAVGVFTENVAYLWSALLEGEPFPILLRWEDAEMTPLAFLQQQWETAFGAAEFPFAEATASGQKLSQTPVAALPLREDQETDGISLTPYGQFDALEKTWGGLISVPGNAVLGPFLIYLTRAFLKLPDDENANGQTLTPEKLWREEITKQTLEIGALADLGKTYLGWSSRFFASAPLPTAKDWSGEADKLFAPARLTSATPKRDEPAFLAPDGLGRLRYTHVIKEDWASLRSYAIQHVPRYRDLHKPNEPLDAPLFNQDSGRIDVAIPRRRKIAPPSLIGLRVLTDPSTERHFHEISFGEHPEAALSQSSIALARKLEFQDTLHHFDLQFREHKWLEKLVKLGITKISAHEITQPDESPRSQQLPSSGLGESDYLAHTPMARFGGRRLMVAAEPYYYKQSMIVAARAVEVSSPAATTPLMRPPGHSPDADPMFGDAVTWQTPKDWVSVERPDLDKCAQKYLQAIKAASMDDIAGALEPILITHKGYSGSVRFPRLVEMLPVESRTRHFAAEMLPNSYGHLPDPDMRLELATESDAARNGLAAIATDRGTDPMACFAIETTSNQHVIAINRREKGDLTQQLIFDMALCGQVRIPEADKISMPAPRLSDRLAQLAALRLRLGKVDQVVDMIDPGIKPAWAWRPSLGVDQKETATLGDVTVGLQLLLHSTKQLATIGSVLANDELLKAVETCAVVQLTKPLSATPIALGFERTAVWHWKASQEAWSEIPWETPVTVEDDDRLLILWTGTPEGDLPGLDSQDMDLYQSFAQNVSLVDGTPDADLAAEQLRQINRLITAVWQARTLSEVSVVAHHGNLPGVPWGKPANSGGILR